MVSLSNGYLHWCVSQFGHYPCFFLFFLFPPSYPVLLCKDLRNARECARQMVVSFQYSVTLVNEKLRNVRLSPFRFCKFTSITWTLKVWKIKYTYRKYQIALYLDSLQIIIHTVVILHFIIIQGVYPWLLRHSRFNATAKEINKSVLIPYDVKSLWLFMLIPLMFFTVVV